MSLMNDKHRLSMILGGLGLLGSKTRNQADKYLQFAAQGLLGGADARKKQAQREKVAALIGSAPGVHEYDMYPGEQRIPGLIDKGSGYLADGDTNKLAAGLLSIPGYEQAALQTIMEKDVGGLNKDMLKYQEGIRKEVTPIAEQLNTMKGQFESLVESAQAGEESRGAADQAMIFSFAKMLDPRSVVRTEEGQAIARTDGYFGQLQGFLNQIKGKGQLTEGARKGLVLEAQRQLKNKANPLLGRINWYKDQVIGGAFPYQKAINPGLLGYGQWMNNYELPTYYGPSLLETKEKPKPKPQKNPKPNPSEADSILDRWGL